MLFLDLRQSGIRFTLINVLCTIGINIYLIYTGKHFCGVKLLPGQFLNVFDLGIHMKFYKNPGNAVNNGNLFLQQHY